MYNNSHEERLSVFSNGAGSAASPYAYSYLAAYETLQQGDSTYASLAGKLNGYTPAPAPEPGKQYGLPLASLSAFTTVGRALTFSSNLWDEFEKEFYKKYQEMNMPESVYERSLTFGMTMPW